MQQLGKITLLALGFGLLAIALFSIPNHQSVKAETIQDVKVTNTPLPVQGTVNANITGNPVVKAEIFNPLSGPIGAVTLAPCPSPTKDFTPACGIPYVRQPTHLGTPLVNLVTLRCNVDTSGTTCASWACISINGATTNPCGSFPLGYSLAIADVSWIKTGCVPGDKSFVSLATTGTTPGWFEFSSDDICDPLGNAANSSHLTSAIVSSGPPMAGVDPSPSAGGVIHSLTISGYFAQ
jgi:hypothetical protein